MEYKIEKLYPALSDKQWEQIRKTSEKIKKNEANMNNVKYCEDEKTNEQMIQYIRRNIPMFGHFTIEGYKVGSSEQSAQQCTVSLAKASRKGHNEYIMIGSFAQIFVENIALREESNKMRAMLEDIFDKHLLPGNEADKVHKFLSTTSPR